MQIAMLLLPALAFQSGGKLQIQDVKVGRGEGAKVGDYITVDYTGKLMNGTQFDSSKGPGREPFKLVLGAGMVIPGWDKGIQGMKVGGKRMLTIPPALAYGAQGAGADIPPNSTLKFEVELRSIERVKIAVLRPGKGPGAVGGDTISLHYKGSLTNGKKFDSSYDRNEPFPVTLGRSSVIPGFTMGLLGIKQGEKRRVTIPSSLGYGAQGAGGVIPPNATLVFELEALRISK
jgi:FKBP-type peptidyl-prolyl cis-trans isomerase